MHSNPTPDPLDSLLQTWKVDKSLDIKESVWGRISLSEHAQANWWGTFFKKLDAWLPKPAIATSLCVLFVTVGFGIGRLKAQEQIQDTNTFLRTSYWQSVDPLQKIALQK